MERIDRVIEERVDALRKVEENIWCGRFWDVDQGGGKMLGEKLRARPNRGKSLDDVRHALIARQG